MAEIRIFKENFGGYLLYPVSATLLDTGKSIYGLPEVLHTDGK
jgi:hypothetical protein